MSTTISGSSGITFPDGINISTDKLAATSGYQKLPGGLILQWGRGAADGTYSFPIPFPNNLLSFAFANFNSSNSGVPRVTSSTLSTFLYSSANAASCPFSYIALGN